MANKPKAVEATPDAASGPRPRLVKLTIKNFRCIGATPVSIDLDDIVVLVGPNNVGKSSVLKAYEVIMSEGSTAGHLSIDDFPSGKVDSHALPEIELHTVVYDNSPGTRVDGEDSVGRDARQRVVALVCARRAGASWLQCSGDNAGPRTRTKRRCLGEPPESQIRGDRSRIELMRLHHQTSKQVEIVKLLMTAIKDRVKSHKADSKTNKDSDFAKLLAGIATLQKKIVAESQEHITAVQTDLSGYIGRVFPGHCVVFDAKPEDDLDKALNLFEANPQLLMGPVNGYLSTIGRQGSGARRTLLWTPSGSWLKQ